MGLNSVSKLGSNAADAYESSGHRVWGSSSAVGQSSEAEADDPELRRLPWPAEPNLDVFFFTPSLSHSK